MCPLLDSLCSPDGLVPEETSGVSEFAIAQFFVWQQFQGTLTLRVRVYLPLPHLRW